MADVKRMQHDRRVRIWLGNDGDGAKASALQTANNELRTNALRTIALEKAIKAIHEETQTLTLERDQLIAERDALEAAVVDRESADSDEQNCDQQCLECENARTTNAYSMLADETHCLPSTERLQSAWESNLFITTEVWKNRFPPPRHDQQSRWMCPTDW